MIPLEMIVPPSHGSTWLSNSFLVIFSLFFLGLICICIWTDWYNIYMNAAACWACICLAVNFACGTMAQGVARAKKFCAAIPAAFATANISTLYSGPLSPSSRQVVDALEQPNFATPHNTNYSTHKTAGLTLQFPSNFMSLYTIR